MGKHKVYKTNPIRKYIILSLFIFLFIGMGYSVLSTSLGIGGNITVWKHDQTLYGVLEYEARKGTYAKKYTGEHQDSMNASLSNKDIYYWYKGNDNNNSTTILDKNNVIFAEHCWQMVRTTDTGGVKIVYNGEPENGQCLNTRGNHVGYTETSTLSMSTTYYYGTDYTFDKTNNVFSLGGTITTGTIQTGQYTCRKTTSTGTCTTLYLVDTLSSETKYNVLSINSNSNYSQFGKMIFNYNGDSLAYVGYMNNSNYQTKIKDNFSETMFTYSSLSTSFFYSDSYDYNTVNADKYTLTNPYQVSSTNDYPSLVGKYTLRSSSSTFSRSSIYYIVAVNSSVMYYIELDSGNNLAYYNDTYTYGDSYTDNGNGTYTINNPSILYKTDYYTQCSILKDKYVCKNAINNTCSELLHVVSNLSGNNCNSLDFIKISNTYRFASGFTYDSGTGKYILNGDNVTMWDMLVADESSNLSTHHYTCFDTVGECTTISYVFRYSSSSGVLYYINLNDGKSVENALNEMLSSNTANQENSTIKTGIDAWYKKYMTNYSSKLEDIIFCNNRKILNLAGWNPNGGNMSSQLSFGAWYNTGIKLNCPNISDRFSVSNSSAQLDYPVGLLTKEEIYTDTSLSTIFFSAENGYWSLSPCEFNSAPSVFYVPAAGYGNANASLSKQGVRPVVSLKPGTLYSSGDGSMANPYIVSNS